MPRFSAFYVVPVGHMWGADQLSLGASGAGGCKSPPEEVAGGYAEETEKAKRIIEPKKAMEEGDTKCFVVMAPKVESSQRRDARVRVLVEETLEECLMAPIEYVESVLLGCRQERSS